MQVCDALTLELDHDELTGRILGVRSQCRRRNLVCEFPKECRRGQHKRTPRLARVNAIVNGEPLQEDDILFVQPHFSPTSPPTSSIASVTSPAKAKAKATIVPSKERRKSGTKPAKNQDTQNAAERRAVMRLQIQMADQQQRQRISQQQRAVVAGPSAT